MEERIVVAVSLILGALLVMVILGSIGHRPIGILVFAFIVALCGYRCYISYRMKKLGTHTHE